jgi:hypothetical protein
MSALAMVLAAGMAIVHGPEKVSAEVGQDLSGEWRGTLRRCNGRERTVTAFFEDDKLSITMHHENGTTRTATYIVINEGKGHLRLSSKVSTRLGIYQQERESLTICYRKAKYGRPTTFRPGDRQMLVTLRRIEPRK